MITHSYNLLEELNTHRRIQRLLELVVHVTKSQIRLSDTHRTDKDDLKGLDLLTHS